MKKRSTLWLVVVVIAMIVAFFSIFPLHLAAPTRFMPNPYPQVVPALREWHGSSGSFILGSGAKIILDPAYASSLQATAQVFQQDVSSETGLALPLVISNDPGSGNFFLSLKALDSNIGNEGYELNIGAAVTINAYTTDGVFYGTRTVLQLLHEAPDHATIPQGFALDYPQYKERGFMLDVGRKFVPLSLLENYVRLMSWYKFNDFQLHFNDNALNGGNASNWQHQYAAFRLNSPAFPGLAAKDGSYTEQQIRQLVQFASVRGVTITPEIDTPAHALALTQYRPALASPQYTKEYLNLSNPATYTFVNLLWNTFLPWFSTSQVAIGADEYALNAASQYREYINYYDRFLHQKGKTIRMWGSLSMMPSNVKITPNIVIEDWDNSWANPVVMARQGFQIINANDNLLYIVPHANYYHDFLDTQLLYDKWEPNIFDLHNSALNVRANDPHLLGGMFAVWNDKLGKIVSDHDITERIVPAMPVLGEKMWTGPISGRSYSQFERTVQQVGQAPETIF